MSEWKSATGEVTHTRIFEAPRALVFRCWIEPEHLTHFWSPVGLSTPIGGIKVDARPGGSFEITSVACDLPAVAVMRSPERPSDRFQIDVRLRPETVRPGKLEGRIRIATSDPRFPDLVVPVHGKPLRHVALGHVLEDCHRLYQGPRNAPHQPGGKATDEGQHGDAEA